MKSPVTRDPSGDPADEWVRREAKEAVGNRVAFASAAIWLVSVSVLYLLVFLPQHMGTAQATLFGVGLLLPAAVPWLFYRRLIAADVERRRKKIREDRTPESPRPNEGAE